MLPEIKEPLPYSQLPLLTLRYLRGKGPALTVVPFARQARQCGLDLFPSGFKRHRIRLQQKATISLDVFFGAKSGSRFLA